MDESTISKQQWQMEEQVLHQLRALGADDKIIKNVWELFDMVNRPFKPAAAQLVDGRYGVRWDFEQGFLSVLFGPDDNWEWETKAIVGKPGDEDCSGYTRHIRYAGKPSFVLHEQPYYTFPDEVDKIISIPEPFEKQYEPMIPKREYKVLWHTNYWDGMLAGYCEYKGNICYFNNVDETTFTHNRMFAVYQLSLYEKTLALFHHYKWNITLYNRTLWDLHMKMRKWKQKFTKTKTSEHYVNETEKFHNSHKILGYFEW